MTDRDAIEFLESEITTIPADDEYRRKIIRHAILSLNERDARRRGCGACSGDYNQRFDVSVVRRHTSDNETRIKFSPSFCPRCGRQITEIN